MNKTHIIGLFLYLVSHFFAYSKIRQGTVNTTDGTPIPEATVLIENQSSPILTDHNGSFIIDLPNGAHSVTISAVGYKAQTRVVKCASSCSLNFYLKKDDLQELKEVVITNDAHKNNILNTTASISEISSATILQTQTEELVDLNSLIPNYVYSDLGVSYQQQITLRGVSAFSEVPSIATYIDGINTFNISANNLLLTDIHKIEVLRGPQGALFGQDAIGGIINIITKKPSNKESVFIKTTIGNQGLFSYTAGFKTPIIKNKLFIGVDGKLKRQNGYLSNDLTGKYLFTGEALEGTPEDGVRIGDKQSAYGNIDIRFKPNTQLNMLFNIKRQIDLSIGASSYYQASLTPKRALENPDVLDVNAIGSDQRDVLNTSLSIDYKKPTYSLYSTSYYSKVKVGYDNIDGDLTPFAFYTASSSYKGILGNPYPMEVFGQEIRIESNNDNNISWLLGGTAFFQDYKRQYSYVAQSLTQEYIDFQKNIGISSFGNVSYQFSEKFNTTVHLRYDAEIKSTEASVSNTEDETEELESIDRKKTFQALSPKLVFSYQPTINHNMYLSLARGFKSGGINNRAPNQNEFSNYKSEFSNVAELGYKWLSSDNKYLFAVTGYGMYWEDMQLYYFTQRVDQLNTGGIWVIDNIGDVTSYGLETEISAQPFTGFQADFSFGVNHGRYEGFEFLGTDIEDNTTILSPEITSFLGVQQLFSISKKKKINATIRGEWRVTGDQYFDLVNTIKQEAYHIFNTKLSIAYNNLSLEFGVKNLFNKRYISFAMPGLFQATILNRPRSIRASLAYRF